MTTIQSSTGTYQIRSITYRAESASIRGRTYDVTVTDEGWTCSCRAAQYTTTRGKCWHLKAAQAGELGKPLVRLGLIPQHPAGDPRIAALADLYGTDYL